MQAKINQVGIITKKFDEMINFYTQVLNFPIKLQFDNYVEFANEGVRFAICNSEVMYELTKNKSYQQSKQGQSIELAFQLNSATQIDSQYNRLIKLGAKPIAKPADMPWGHRAAFFADPDNNIHEIFALLK